MTHGDRRTLAVAVASLALPTFGCSGSATSDFVSDAGVPVDASSNTPSTGASPSSTHTLGQEDGGSSASTSSCGAASLNREGCACEPGQSTPCYTGPAATRGVGTCHDGTQSCVSQGEFASYGACVGETLPASATDCVKPVDAGVESSLETLSDDAGETKVPVLTADAGEDANPLLSVGAACAPGSVSLVPEGDDAGLACSAQASGGSESVLYCESSAVWQCFPAGDCSPAACATCMQTQCATVLGQAMSQSTACQQAIQTGFEWLEDCGPDRSAYFQSLGAACPDGIFGMLQQCKDQCLRGTAGPCSFY